MRRYTVDEEQRIRMQANVRAWTRAGLLDADQAQRLEADLRTDLKRTHVLLRAAIAFFTAIIIGASVGLVFVVLSFRDDVWTAATVIVAGAICLALAEWIVGAARVYRYGVEEVLAVAAVILVSVGVLIFLHAVDPTSHLDTIGGLATGAFGGFVVYRRFGFVYAGVGAMACAGLIPFQFEMTEWIRHVVAAAAFAAMFAAARSRYRSQGDDFPGDEYAILEAAACVGAYLSMNLHAIDVAGWWRWHPAAPGRSVFYWSTYAAIWIVPAVALLDAIRAKDRALLTTGLALALITIATNKAYLGWPRQTWDPMLLGLVLIGGTLAVRRWLAAGPGGQRNGHTPARILEDDRGVLAAARNASVTWHDRLVPQPPTSAEAPSQFAGGRSGGGGGGASY